MDNLCNYTLTNEEKEKFISALSPALMMLRTKANISQDDLSNLLGVSRQTYGAIERGSKRMSWNTYISLIFFYDYNKQTHDLLRNIEVFPTDLISRMNCGDSKINVDLSSLFTQPMMNMFNELDEQAMNSLRTVLLVEYARCTDMSDDSIIKAFSGLSFKKSVDKKTVAIKSSIKLIKESQRIND